MLTIQSDNYSGQPFCDGMSRRSFLKIGGLALGGLSMPELLFAQAQAGQLRSHKAIIMIYLAGGPPHMDMWDLKPDAPSEIRGELSPIRTNVPGVQICELFPRIAKMMDKFVAIRSIVGSAGGHHAYQCLSGHSHRNQPAGGWPYIGAVLSRFHGPIDPAVPVAIDLQPKASHVEYSMGRQPGFLGPAHAPFRSADEQIKNDMVLKGITLERLQDRKSLLSNFDQFRRSVDTSGLMASLDASHQQAFGILTSNKLAEAFDLEKENPALRDRYGYGDAGNRGDAAPRNLQQFLLARRLVEAGARCVTLGFGGWDYHKKNFILSRIDMPWLDQGVSALVQDLHDRGLDQDVSVVVWGEFGRTPKINYKGGRDHWPNVSCALLAGGGMRTGQTIGETDRHAAEIKDRPVHFQEVFATLYHNLGINAANTTMTDLDGRPHYLLDGKHKPLPELV